MQITEKFKFFNKCNEIDPANIMWILEYYSDKFNDNL